MLREAPVPHGAWMRLNADTLLLAGLALFGGISDLADPSRSDIVSDIGAVTPVHYMRSVGYVLAGLGILFGLARNNIRAEVLGRAVLIASLVVTSSRHGIVFGWTAGPTLSTYVLLVLVGFTTWLRLSILLGRQELHVTVPAREGES